MLERNQHWLSVGNELQSPVYPSNHPNLPLWTSLYSNVTRLPPLLQSPVLGNLLKWLMPSFLLGRTAQFCNSSERVAVLTQYSIWCWNVQRHSFRQICEAVCSADDVVLQQKLSLVQFFARRPCIGTPAPLTCWFRARLSLNAAWFPPTQLAINIDIDTSLVWFELDEKIDTTLMPVQ